MAKIFKDKKNYVGHENWDGSDKLCSLGSKAVIYSEEQKKIRDACAKICVMVGQNPNAIAPDKYRSWVSRNYVKKEEPVRAWMLWIGTIEAAGKRKEWLKLKEKGQDKETLERRANIARMIEESNPGQDPRYKYHTQKH